MIISSDSLIPIKPQPSNLAGVKPVPAGVVPVKPPIA
jgi:hypothetical protein